MTKLDFEKTPEEKLAHVEANFGTDSLYAKSLRTLVQIAGNNPSAEEFSEALTIVEGQVDEHFQKIKPRS